MSMTPTDRHAETGPTDPIQRLADLLEHADGVTLPPCVSQLPSGSSRPQARRVIQTEPLGPLFAAALRNAAAQERDAIAREREQEADACDGTVGGQFKALTLRMEAKRIRERGSK